MFNALPFKELSEYNCSRLSMASRYPGIMFRAFLKNSPAFSRLPVNEYKTPKFFLSYAEWGLIF